MTHRLLILGSLGEFVQLVQKAKARGIWTLVCDGYAEGPARRYADEHVVIPVTQTEQIAALCRERKVDGILTSFSDLLLECMVKIADAAGLNCYLHPAQLPWYRDKAAAKELLSALGLPAPAFRRIPVSCLGETDAAGTETLSRCLRGLSFPLVCKPLDKYGSRGIYVTENEEEFRRAALQTAAFTDLPEILAEEYNTGYEFNLMSWVLDQEVHVISIADREKTPVGPGQIPISTRNVYPSCLLSHVEAEARELLSRFIRHTGQKDGALSMQFFWSPQKGIQVCEIAARFFGYEHELTDLVFGFNIEDLLLDSIYDRPSLRRRLLSHRPDQTPFQQGAVLYFQGRPMKIADLSPARNLAWHTHVKKPWIFYQEGETVTAGAQPYAALYYITADTREELDQVTEEFFEKMSMRGEHGEEILYRNRIPKYER